MTSRELQSHFDRYAADPSGYEPAFINALKFHIESRVSSLPGRHREDAAQEITIQVWAALESYDVTRPFSSWVNTIARNWLADHFKSVRGRDARMTMTFTDMETFTHDADGTADVIAYEPTATCPPLPPVDYSPLVTVPDWITGKDRQLAELIVTGQSLQSAADLMGDSFATTQRRMARLTNKCLAAVQ